MLTLKRFAKPWNERPAGSRSIFDYSFRMFDYKTVRFAVRRTFPEVRYKETLWI